VQPQDAQIKLMVIHITKITRGNYSRRKARSTYREQHHHHTHRVRSLQAGRCMITASISRELHTHRHTCRCESNPNKYNLHGGVWIKRR
jgi:hypothetical protein